ncbi:MAG: hypothetical protein ACOY3Y_04910 [Acidobacteriota bacterium]
MTLSSHRLGLLLLLLLPCRALAWQDLAEPYVQGQLEKLVDRKVSAGDKLRATWTLVEAARAALHPLGELATRQPKLAWEAVRMMDSIRTDAEVPRRFSSFLDALPAGLRKVPGARASLQSRLEDMLGRRFASGTERAGWIKANADYLRYDPARFRYVVDEGARARRQPLVPTPQAQTGREAIDLGYAKLILALHLGNVEIVRSLVGPRVRLERKQNREDTFPGIDLDAFHGPPAGHRAQAVRAEGSRWLYRSSAAYFRLELVGGKVLCVEAGFKPIK